MSVAHLAFFMWAMFIERSIFFGCFFFFSISPFIGQLFLIAWDEAFVLGYEESREVIWIIIFKFYSKESKFSNL